MLVLLSATHRADIRSDGPVGILGPGSLRLGQSANYTCYGRPGSVPTNLTWVIPDHYNATYLSPSEILLENVNAPYNSDGRLTCMGGSVAEAHLHTQAHVFIRSLRKHVTARSSLTVASFKNITCTVHAAIGICIALCKHTPAFYWGIMMT